MTQITDVRIYQVSTDGTSTGSPNIWTYGPLIPATSRCLPSARSALAFYESTHAWNTGTRDNGVLPTSIGVSITYKYSSGPARRHPAVLRWNGWAQLTMTDKTVMALEPTS